jgi:hypothetical protein
MAGQIWPSTISRGLPTPYLSPFSVLATPGPSFMKQTVNGRQATEVGLSNLRKVCRAPNGPGLRPGSRRQARRAEGAPLKKEREESCHSRVGPCCPVPLDASCPCRDIPSWLPVSRGLTGWGAPGVQKPADGGARCRILAERRTATGSRFTWSERASAGYQVAPPAGFEPALTAPESVAVICADQRKHVRNGYGGA